LRGVGYLNRSLFVYFLVYGALGGLFGDGDSGEPWEVKIEALARRVLFETAKYLTSGSIVT
jgi:hypothetical protein